MRILIIGGTAFVGRHIAAGGTRRRARRDAVSPRQDRSGPVPAATHLTGDRDQDLSALADGSWDATIDICAYFPRQVQLAGRRARRPGRQVRLHLQRVGLQRRQCRTATTRARRWPRSQDPDATEVTNENYGGLKVACEHVSTELFGPATTIIRPTYVIGPYDRTYRFTWWVDRIARGGNVLAPGDPDDPIQLIDARD